MSLLKTSTEESAKIAKRSLDAMDEAAQKLAQDLKGEAAAELAPDLKGEAAAELAPDPKKETTDQVGRPPSALDRAVEKLEEATGALGNVLDQSRSLSPRQGEEITRAASAIVAGDAQKLDESVTQMTHELERLGADRADATSDVDRLANDRQSTTLDAARRVAETARDALRSVDVERPAEMTGADQLRGASDKVSTELREQAGAARALYEPPAGAPPAQPTEQASTALRAAQELEQNAQRLDAAQGELKRATDVGGLTDRQTALVSRTAEALQQRNESALAGARTALDRERASLQQSIASARQPLTADATMREAVEWKSAQQHVQEDQKQLDTLTSARKLADTASDVLRQQSDLQERAFSAAFSQDFAKTPAINTVWEAAKANKGATPDGFAQAREAFWQQINTGASAAARAVGEMLRAAGYELGEGTSAPILEQRWEPPRPEVLERIAQRDPDLAQRLNAQAPRVDERKFETLQASDRGLSIDHLAPRSKTPALTLEASNLRLISRRDNSFRGSRFTADDKLASRLVEATALSSKGDMTVEEAYRQIAERETKARLAADAEEVAKKLKLEMAKLEAEHVIKAGFDDDD